MESKPQYIYIHPHIIHKIWTVERPFCHWTGHMSVVKFCLPNFWNKFIKRLKLILQFTHPLLTWTFPKGRKAFNDAITSLVEMPNRGKIQFLINLIHKASSNETCSSLFINTNEKLFKSAIDLTWCLLAIQNAI